MISRAISKDHRKLIKSLALAGLGLAWSAGAGPAMAQQSGRGVDVQATNPPTASQGNAQTGSPATQQFDPQPAQPQSDSQEQAAPPEQPPPQAETQTKQSMLPQSLTLPAGTVVRVRLDDWISSERNVIGDSFSAVLADPIVVDGWVVGRRGQSETGRVTQVKKGGHGTSQLGIDLAGLTLVDGQQVPVQTELLQTSGGTSAGRDAAVIGTTTGVGAVIGAIAGRGVGAAIGAGVGATAGIVGVMSTPGRPAVVAPETVLSFRLQQPVTISTANSQFAFKPVSQSDYDSRPSQNRPRMERPGPPPPAYYSEPYGYPYAYGYPYPYGGYYYPGPYVGFGYYGRFGRFGGYRR